MVHIHMQYIDPPKKNWKRDKLDKGVIINIKYLIPFFFRDIKINVILDTKNADKKSKTFKKKNPMHSFIKKKQASVLLS